MVQLVRDVPVENRPPLPTPDAAYAGFDTLVPFVQVGDHIVQYPYTVDVRVCFCGMPRSGMECRACGVAPTPVSPSTFLLTMHAALVSADVRIRMAGREALCGGFVSPMVTLAGQLFTRCPNPLCRMAITKSSDDPKCE